MLPTEENKTALLSTLVKQGPVIFLESQKPDHPASETSFIAAEPKTELIAHGDVITLRVGHQTTTWKQNPWEALREFRNRHKDWMFGYLGYDLKNFSEKLHSKNPALYLAPDLYMMIPGLLVQMKKAQGLLVHRGRLPKIKKRTIGETSCTCIPKATLDKKQYVPIIKEIKQRIKNGDFYEINFSYPLEYEFEGDALALYRNMKLAGPVPFGAFVQMQELSICSSSPERFLKKNGQEVISQPIKGTVENGSLSNWKQQLLTKKNKAENLMIVDLVRNDMNRVAQLGSVEVPDLFEIQSFDTVHQLVSTIKCEVEADTDPVDIIQSSFPMGSMTGAPKIAAMQAIEELESYRRGIYSGAIGYIAPSGDFDFNVVIRTAIIQNNTLHYPVGGAITSDSDPDEEWQETRIKAKALLNSLK